MPALDSLKTLRSLAVDGKTYHYYSLPEAARTLGDLGKLPMSLKVLLEKPPALGGRQHRHRRRPQGPRRLA